MTIRESRYGKSIVAQFKDGHLEQQIVNRLHLTGFIAKASNLSHQSLLLI
jgi:hypothetical protein